MFDMKGKSVGSYQPNRSKGAYGRIAAGKGIIGESNGKFVFQLALPLLLSHIVAVSTREILTALQPPPFHAQTNYKC
jgi:hypothetical protein